MTESVYDVSYAEIQLKRAGTTWRRIIKKYYLRNILKDVHGPTLDFGCGAGQLLECLPDGSMGLEINSHLVEKLRARSLNVQYYDYNSDHLLLSEIRPHRFNTFVMSHVIEHFESAADVLYRLFRTCRRLYINRIIIVVPGKKGYSSDATHRTFVNRQYLAVNGLLSDPDYRMIELRYFPIKYALWGYIFKYQELKIVWESRSDYQIIKKRIV